MTATPSAQLRDQMSKLRGVFAVSMMLFDRVEADEIVKLVVDALPALGPCRAVGTYLLRGPASSGGFADLDASLRGQLTALAGADGAVGLPDAEWAWAYPLRAVGGHSGTATPSWRQSTMSCGRRSATSIGATGCTKCSPTWPPPGAPRPRSRSRCTS